MKEPSWTADPLSYLIDSVSNEVFFAQHYEQEALICAHNNPNHFAELLSIKRVDEIIASSELPPASLDIATKKTDNKSY